MLGEANGENLTWMSGVWFLARNSLARDAHSSAEGQTRFQPCRMRVTVYCSPDLGTVSQSAQHSSHAEVSFPAKQIEPGLSAWH
jgi:hypothetical protein